MNTRAWTYINDIDDLETLRTLSRYLRDRSDHEQYTLSAVHDIETGGAGLREPMVQADHIVHLLGYTPEWAHAQLERLRKFDLTEIHAYRFYKLTPAGYYAAKIDALLTVDKYDYAL